tara:strand:- start:6794 stop:7597 length:804 start_codon:yes stop_codon:yes gene_type:complete
MNNFQISISIILPTINEEENLRSLIPDLIENITLNNIESFEIIIMDDGSTDNTKELINSINKENNSIKFFKRDNEPSLPMAIWEGINNAKSSHVLWMDADGSMPAESVGDFIKIIKENPNQVVIGSRFADGGAYKGILELEEKSLFKAIFNVYKSNDTVLGMVFSNMFNRLLRFIFKSKVLDITSGFIVGKKEFFSEKSFNKSSYGEYFIYVVSDLLKSNIEIIEKGYVCETRKYGESKTATSLVQLIKRGYPYIKVALKVRDNNGN